MPELLEVETYRCHAEPVIGREIVSIDAPDDWFLKGTTATELAAVMVGRNITGLRRHGKLLLVELDDGTRVGLHFGMTGRLLVDGAAAIDQLEYSSGRNDPAWDRVVVHLDDGIDLRIRDPRRLGGVSLEPDEDRLGPDAWSLSAAQLDEALGTSRASLKARLLDQARVAGIGNLLADEILWRAGLDPARPAGGLTAGERAGLLRAIVETLDDLMARGGSHMGDLRAASARDGRCPRDGAPLQKKRLAGRTTISCPVHQR